MFWTFASLFIIIFLAFYQYLRSRNDIFKLLGYPGPQPTLLLGNLREFFGTSFPLQDDPETAKNVSMFTARGIRWKRLRNISNPTFTAAKLKLMLPILQDSILELLEILDKKCQEGKPFDIYPFYQGMTLDTIARVAFGYETSVQQDKNSEILKLCRTIFSAQTLKGNPFTLAAMLFPELKSPLLKVGRLTARFRGVPGLLLTQKLRKVVDERRKIMTESKGQRMDFIQMMLEAESNEGWETETKFRTENAQRTQEQIRELKVAKKLNSEEIVSQSLVFLLAGFETTSTALAFVSYLLAKNPRVQIKLQKELDTLLESESHISYDSVTKLPYLDCVIREALRLYPIASAVCARESSGPCKIGDVYIPGGLTVSADVWTIHYSSELWGDDVHEFRPERSTMEEVRGFDRQFSRFEAQESHGRHPVAWMPFGIGPRNCIGKRFALLEEKLTLSRLLLRFSITACSETEDNLKLQGNQTVGPEHVTILLRRRN